MKNKLVYILAAVCMMGVSIGLYQIDFGNDRIRVHQHLESKWQKTQTEDNGGFKTNLPIIMINTYGEKVPGTPIVEDNLIVGYETATNGETTIKASFKVVDGQKGANYLMDKPTITSTARIKYRGYSSRLLDKKSYLVRLFLGDNKENKKGVAGMEPHEEWVLSSSYIDRSLLRDYLGMNISGEIMEYAPNVRYCELFVNGEYQGLYILMESVSKGEGRIDIQKPEKNKNMTSYIVCWDRAGKDENELNDYLYYTYRTGTSALNVCYPGQKQMTDGRKAYINDDINKIERVLDCNDFLVDNKNCKQYVDLNAFAEYFIINEFFRNVDAGKFSTYLYKDVRGKLKPCVWDFNNMCDNYMEQSFDKGGFDMVDTPLFNDLIKDKEFIDLVTEKYRHLRKGSLKESYILKYIDETNSWLEEPVKRNFEVWGNVFDISKYNHLNYLTPVERNLTSHTAAVEQLKFFITERGNWMDKHIDSLYQYCHKSKNVNKLIN